MAECLAAGVGYTVDPDTGCWLWQQPAPNGYGPYLAAWYAEHPDPLPDGINPTHQCTGGPRGCIRPDHLTLAGTGRPPTRLPTPPLPPDMRDSFARRLRDEREARGATVQQLAVLLGVSPSTIRGWESAQHAPTVDQVARLAREFGWDEQPRKWVVAAVVERVVIAVSAGAAARQVRDDLNVPGHADKVVIGTVRAIG